jgi:thiol-disulfide isomerase/thioredoxin
MRAIFFIFLSVSFVFAEGQRQYPTSSLQLYNALAIGDKIPPLFFGQMVNYNSETANLNNFTAGLLLIDFWNTHCGACIASFPKLEALQKQFDGRIKIILVSDQKKQVIENFLASRKAVMKLVTSLPIICNDSILYKLFPHQIEPHYAWVNRSGTVIAITGRESVTEQNIAEILQEKQVNLPQKIDKDITYDSHLPLYVNGNGGNGETFLYHSILSGYSNEVLASTSVTCNKEAGYGIRVFNQDIRSLYQVAYDTGLLDNGLGQYGLPLNVVNLEVPDTSKYVMKSIYSSEPHANDYCYELIAPASSCRQLKQMMQDDLKRYIGLTASMEKRKTKCLILAAEDTNTVSSRNRGELYWNLSDYHIRMKNIPFNRFLVYLMYSTNLYFGPYPIIDETGIKGNIDMDFFADASNPESLNGALKKYKMSFTVQEREIDILVLRKIQ